MAYKIGEVYTGKEYTCKKCNAKIYYAKLEDEKGLITKDGQPPNGKFGKESNVLSAAVDVLNKDQIHSCVKDFIDKKVDELQNTSQGNSIKTDIKANVPDVELGGMDQIKDAYRKLFKLADEIVTELYPSLDNENIRGQIRSRVMDQIQKERELRILSNQ